MIFPAIFDVYDRLTVAKLAIGMRLNYYQGSYRERLEAVIGKAAFLFFLLSVTT